MTIWKIVQLDRKIADGFVTTAHWRCDNIETIIEEKIIIEETNEETIYDVPAENIFSASAYGSVSFSGELTTPYDKLTQEQVLEWVWKQIDKAEIELKLAAQIESQKNPISAKGVPW